MGALILCTALFASLQFEYFNRTLVDIQFWTPIIGCTALALAFAIHQYEHERSTSPSGLLLLYWPLYLVLNGLKLHCLPLHGNSGRGKILFILLAVSEGVAVLIFVLEWLVPKPRSEYQALNEDEKKCPIEDADIFSVLTFGWMTPLMRAGYNKFLTEHDLWNVRKKDSAHHTKEQFTAAWEKELKKSKPNLWVALARAFGAPYAEAALYKIVQDVLNYAQPQLLRYLIAFVASYRSGSPQPLSTGLGIAVIMFTASVVQTLTDRKSVV